MRIEALVVIKALADETRMRILAVLSREPLNVQEIQRVLNLKQSRVSRHLKIMERAGLLEGHREGAFVYYKYHQSIPHTPGLIALFASLGLIQNSRLMSDQAHWPASNEALLLPDEYGEDLERLEQLLEERRAATIDHFEQLQTGQEIGQQELVDSNYYRQGILRLLPDEPGVVADLGCGGGELSAMLARRVGRLICIDQSTNMLERARRIIDSPQVEFRLGAIEHLPLGNAEARTVIASMVLHHVPDPDSAIREIVRVLAPGGRLILVELEQHRQEYMRSHHADFWMGFPLQRLKSMLGEAGLDVQVVEQGAGEGTLQCLFLVATRSIAAKAQTATADERQVVLNAT